MIMSSSKKKKNVVVDALYKKYEEDRFLFSLSFMVIDWLEEVHHEWLQDPKLSRIIEKMQHDLQAYLGY
jgi:hypothetical protein